MINMSWKSFIKHKNKPNNIQDKFDEKINNIQDNLKSKQEEND